MRIYTTDEMMTRCRTMQVTRCPYVKSFKEHTHEFIELVYITSGAVEHTVDGHSYSLKHGDILFMNCGCTHSFCSDEDFTYVNILFSPEFVGESIVNSVNAFSLFSLTAFNEMRGGSEFGKVSFFGNERREIENLIEEMLDEYEAQETYWESVLRNHLNTLIIKMIRKTEMGIAPKEMDDIWYSLSEYIDNNIDSKLTLSELAQKCFYNPSYFSRIFKEKFGVSLMEYVTKKRVDHAIELLSNTDISVDEISSRVGFSDRNSLYHAFSKYGKGSPRSYRTSADNVKKGDKTK